MTHIIWVINIVWNLPYRLQNDNQAVYSNVELEGHFEVENMVHKLMDDFF